MLSQLASCLARSSRTFAVTSLFKHTPRKDNLLLQSNVPARLSLCNASDSSEHRDNLTPGTPAAWSQQYCQLEPELDWDYLLHPDNTEDIDANIKSRKGVGDIEKVIGFANLYLDTENEEAKEVFRQDMLNEALKIPNRSHPNVIKGPEKLAKKVEICGEKKKFQFLNGEKFKPKLADSVAQQKGLNMMRLKNLTLAHGDDVCYFERDLAYLERALVNFTLDYLMDKGFEFVSVPDILYTDVVEGAGQNTKMENGSVYHMLPECLPKSCLAGTSEMALSGYFANEELSMEELPRRVCAVSRCYRAEADQQGDEKGMYRMHLFNKVEMFGLAANETGDESEALLQYFLEIQRDLFSKLGLRFKILDMPSEELGAPAYKKYDIEAWMYAKKKWGEISSTSNCIDYQARRMNIRYRRAGGDLRHVHTVNGTACAVPRLLLSILEQNQQFEDGHLYLWNIKVPSVLLPYMDGLEKIERVDKKAAWVVHKQ